MTWFKFWCDAHAHPKLSALTDSQFRLLTYIWALAQRSPEPGKAYVTPKIGITPYHLAIGAGLDLVGDPECAATPESELLALERVGLIARDHNGVITVHDWDAHNGRPPSMEPDQRAEAKRAERARKRAEREAADLASQSAVARMSQAVATVSQRSRKTEEEEEEEKDLTTLPAAPGGESPAPIVEKRKSNPRHRQTIDLFMRLWSELRGGTYRVVGARDGSAVKSLLGITEATDAEIERRMRLAFADPWFKSQGHLALFASRWANYDGRGSSAPAGKPLAIARMSKPEDFKEEAPF